MEEGKRIMGKEGGEGMSYLEFTAEADTKDGMAQLLLEAARKVGQGYTAGTGWNLEEKD